ncbi:MAG: hypothetical protein MJA83_08530, partial [Gammaproteobacteria bacterium]|nr:hypothetical protein [Gammaproteobacteria bacterium]
PILVLFLQSSSSKQGPASLLLFFALVSVAFWNVAVIGHIFRHALNVTFTKGIILALLYAFIYYGSYRSLFSLPAGTQA